ncbi:MAG: ABC transporter permease [Alphaproteobacteria bacterium]|nr:ABC transporter permease [Alphaproteobacteria bacterium]
MIWVKLVFGGFGRRGLEAIIALAILILANAIVAGSLMVIQGARDAIARTAQNDRPDVVQVKSRFNRALFETPRGGNLPPLMLPVYEPLIDPDKFGAVEATVLARQSFLRNVVSGESFLNIYIFGIDPEKEPQVSTFSVDRGRFLRGDDAAVAVVDRASAKALGVDLGGTFPVRKADGEDLTLTVVGILDRLELRYPPPRTVDAPALSAGSSSVTSGVFVTLRTSEEIFARPTLTDALLVAPTPEAVPAVVGQLREAFRLEPGVFVSESYSRFRRKVQDFVLTLALFTALGAATAVLAGSFGANLLHDVYADRRRQAAMLLALGFRPMQSAMSDILFGLTTVAAAAVLGSLLAAASAPRQFAMPSLMAELGTIEPRFDALIVAVMAGIALAILGLGIGPTAWQVRRRSVAATLSEERG